MRFIADENIDHAIVLKLRSMGHDVLSASETFPTSPDHHILEHANRDERLLLTSDKDFGKLVYRQGLVHQGIVLLRLSELPPLMVIDLVSHFIEQHQDELLHKYSVFAPGHVRIRPMKAP